MQGKGLRGVTIRGTEIISIEKQELETIILDVKRKKKEALRCFVWAI
jgi:hypothetical protein